MITLDSLGERICIIGCSNAGKSTLANALGKKLNLPVYHLDQFAHLENSAWQRISDDILIEQHKKIIANDAWIIDGNYSVCMQPRFERATSIIWLDPSVYSSIYRYLLRCMKNNKNRHGNLHGAKNEFSFGLIKHVFLNYPKNRLKYQKLIDTMQHIPIIYIKSMSILKNYYRWWQL